MNTQILEDAEVRTLAIDLFTMPSARDAQRRIGASNLSNGCDFCLASNIMGDMRESAMLDRLWGGRTIGTAAHHLLDERVNTVRNDMTNALAERLEGAKPEEHVWFADFEHYGLVGGSIDLLLPAQLVDWKGSTRKKSALFQDYMQRQGGYRVDLPPRWEHQKRGNYKLELGSGASISLSAKDYEAEMAKQSFKVDGYFGQQTLYMRGAGVTRASLVFINRDGTMYFDNPALDRYSDPKATHDVWVYSFDYDPDYADALIARGQAIINHLFGGGTVDDFVRHEHCFACGLDARDAEKVEPIPAIDVQFELAAAA